MNNVRQLFFILVASIVFPSLLLSMHNSDARVAYESAMIKKIKPLLELQDVVLNEVLIEYPDEVAALNRFVMNVHENCVSSSNPMCDECHVLLQTTVKVVKPFLQHITEKLQQVELMNNVARDHYPEARAAVNNGIQEWEPRSRTFFLHTLSLALFVIATSGSIYHADCDIALYGYYALATCLIRAVVFSRIAPVPSSVIVMQVLYCSMLTSLQNYIDRANGL